MRRTAPHASGIQRYLQYGGARLPEDGTLPPVTWAGARYVERAVLIGTPNAGSAQALVDLVEGRRFPFPLPSYAPEILGTMPSIYQPLPRTRHGAVVDAADPGGPPIDVPDPAVWSDRGWGLAAPPGDRVIRWVLPGVADPAVRRRIALDHLAKSLGRARQFHAALDRAAEPPPGLTLHLFAGDAKPTPAVLAADRGTGKLMIRHSTRPVTAPSCGRARSWTSVWGGPGHRSWSRRSRGGT